MLNKEQQKQAVEAFELWQNNPDYDPRNKAHARIAWLAAWEARGRAGAMPTNSHEWDASGERCVECGDKDWLAGPNCNGRAGGRQEPPLSVCGDVGDGFELTAEQILLIYRALVSASPGGQEVGKGHKLVPLKADSDMVEAMWRASEEYMQDNQSRDVHWRVVYEAALAAAPQITSPAEPSIAEKLKARGFEKVTDPFGGMQWPTNPTPDYDVDGT